MQNAILYNFKYESRKKNNLAVVSGLGVQSGSSPPVLGAEMLINDEYIYPIS